MNKVSKIELIFDNCEFVYVPADCIGNISISEIHRRIVGALGVFYHVEIADEVAMRILPKARDVIQGGLYDDIDVFSRIQSYRDITHVGVYYVDGTEQYLSTDYKPEDPETEMENEYQKSYISPVDGSLLLVIAKDKYFCDYASWERGPVPEVVEE